MEFPLELLRFQTEKEKFGIALGCFQFGIPTGAMQKQME